jgi:hypothetical protein
MKRKYTRCTPVIRKTGNTTRKPVVSRTKSASQIKMGPAQVTYTDEPLEYKRYVFDRLFWLAVLLIIAITIIAIINPGQALKGGGITGAGIGVGAGIKKLFKRHPT